MSAGGASADALGEPRLRWVDGTVGRLRVETGGGGSPALVFVHALAGSRRQWAPQMERFGAKHLVIAPDLAGHGDSEAPAGGEYSIERAAEDVVRITDALVREPVVLVGHSFGAGVAVRAAAEHPQRVLGLLLVDPIGDGRSGKREMRRLLADFRRGSPRAALRGYWEAILRGATGETRTRVLEDFESTPAEVILSALSSTVSFDAVALLGAYAGPKASVITPLNNHPTSLHRVVRDLPAAEVEGTSHWLQLDRPAALAAELERFLSGLS